MAATGDYRQGQKLSMEFYCLIGIVFVIAFVSGFLCGGSHAFSTVSKWLDEMEKNRINH